ncbi:histidine phosphatase family protein [Pseudactinotalea sp. HY160]|uniref:SixA phosphatase family protein n=1 Tax=Pseudactinotalea sp. HY160 TaxID=2654490 RepID=UPI00128E66E0|nr:histidine phosphatase family protein [Pseudactinotalea sp. HY160]MPV49846.1 histidine phosphatase family protein [Pseudactinotalea sp. HY160]
MATLLLLRHAKAEPRSGPDERRPLSATGRDQAGRVAEHLRNRRPDVVLCSAAVRTQQTWQRLAYGLADHGIEVAGIEVVVLESLYRASPRAVLAAVSEYGGDAGVVLVVGHEPIMSMTAAALAGPGSHEAGTHVVAAGLSTASLAVIEVDSPWREVDSGHARLVEVLHTPA